MTYYIQLIKNSVTERWGRSYIENLHEVQSAFRIVRVIKSALRNIAEFHSKNLNVRKF